ncbi:hypothetical protein GCM10027072_79370 [Streptomyces bullii]
MSQSSLWRYVVRRDGSFFRTVNVDSHLDDVSDDELLRLRPTAHRDERPLRRRPAAVERPVGDRRVDGALPGL